jgi:hypothetical protein
MTKEERKLKNQKYHAAHREEISLRKKRWALENPEKINKHKKDNPEYQADYIRQYRRKYPERCAAYARKTNYGVTQEWFENKLKEQNNRCAICFCIMIKPCVDHNHETDTPRGLLCHACNVFLGYAHEDPVRFSNAIEYLKKYKGRSQWPMKRRILSAF